MLDNLLITPHRSALFLQATDAAAYPPIINAATLLAENGWRVTVLTAPIVGHQFEFPTHPNISLETFDARPTHVMSKSDYFRYCMQSAELARRLKPDIIYGSDIFGGGASLIASKLGGSKIVYHEHDSPPTGRNGKIQHFLRTRAARAANLVIFPNEERGRIAQTEIGFSKDRLRVVWNTPLKADIPQIARSSEAPLMVYYHGSINRDRIPSAIVSALARFGGRIALTIIGYESPNAIGYVAELEQLAQKLSGMNNLVHSKGLLPRSQVIIAAAEADVGLALMPIVTTDINMRYMTGASNKIFDYMAAGLVPLVSDLPDWKTTFVHPGYALSCNPNDEDSISVVFEYLLTNRHEIRLIRERNRAKIMSEWNYDVAFKPVISELEQIAIK